MLRLEAMNGPSPAPKARASSAPGTGRSPRRPAKRSEVPGEVTLQRIQKGERLAAVVIRVLGGVVVLLHRAKTA